MWVVTALVVGVLIATHPTERTVGTVYDHAVVAWWSGLELYRSGDGFAYLPHFAVLYTPFHALGVPWGILAWMIVSVAWLGSVHWQLMRCIDPGRSGRYFFFATLLSLPLCVGAIHNGQTNALFAAATVQAVVFLMRSRWSAAAAMLMVALAFKPLGMVLLLLAPAVYRPLRTRVLLAIGIFLAVPFLFGAPAYVAGQYGDFLENIAHATVITDHRFANVPGIFRSLGVWPPAATSTALSLAGAAAALLAWVIGARVTAGPQRGLLLLAIATSYLMLFNPMNESNSYVIVALAMAAVAITFLDGGQRPAAGCWSDSWWRWVCCPSRCAASRRTCRCGASRWRRRPSSASPSP